MSLAGNYVNTNRWGSCRTRRAAKFRCRLLRCPPGLRAIAGHVIGSAAGRRGVNYGSLSVRSAVADAALVGLTGRYTVI